MNSWTSKNFRFDTGPSLITMPWVFEELYEAAGSRLQEYLKMIPMHPLSSYSFADGTRFTYTADLPEWLATIRQLEPCDVDGFLRLMKLGARIYELSQNTFLRRVPFAPPRITDGPALRNFPLSNAWENYAKVVATHFKSPLLRQLYNRYPTYVGSSPYSSPATLLIIPYIEYAFNGWYPEGGLYRIVQSLLDLARLLGVTLVTNAKVEHIEHQQNQVRAVKLVDGTRLPANIVIANCEAADAKVMLGESLAERLKPNDRSMSSVVFLLGIRRILPELNHHQIYCYCK